MRDYGERLVLDSCLPSMVVRVCMHSDNRKVSSIARKGRHDMRHFVCKSVTNSSWQNDECNNDDYLSWERALDIQFGCGRFPSCRAKFIDAFRSVRRICMRQRTVRIILNYFYICSFDICHCSSFVAIAMASSFVSIAFCLFRLWRCRSRNALRLILSGTYISSGWYLF